jgi:crotonobetainyl-CoA:carnitine CoA-transferase CaiB-like acyl-CoA transferase
MLGPLGGLVVAEANSAECPLAVRIATAFAGRIFADLGAEVLKLEPPGGDPLRKLPPLTRGVGSLFAFLNAGKKSVAADPVQGRELQVRVLGGADVALVDDALAPALERAARVTGVASMAPADSPAAVQASEFTIMALGGLLDVVGDPAREPLRLGGHQLAYSTGLSLFTGTSAALSGLKDRREVVRSDLLNTAIWLNWKSVATASWGGAVPTRLGEDAEWRVVRSADGWVALVHRAEEWGELKKLVNDPRLEDARFQSRSQRRLHAAEVSSIVEQKFLQLSRQQLREAALARRIPLGPVWSPRELLQDPQNVARDFLCLAATSGDGPRVVMPRLPVVWGGRTFAPGPVPVEATAAAHEAGR